MTPATIPSFRTAAGFAAFDMANPGYWDLFVFFAMDRMAAGFNHYSARDIIHRMRWECPVVTADDEACCGFLINDHASPWYARKFHALLPQYDGFFRMRPSRADKMRVLH